MQAGAPRAGLVGNAEQTLHPIGAQGFNLGLRDALTLAELVETRGGDPGDPGLLADHAQRREEDRGRTLAMSDGLARLTANDAPLLRPLRSLGLLRSEESRGGKGCVRTCSFRWWPAHAQKNKREN